MTQPNPSINSQSALILGGVTTAGDGTFVAPLRQQHVNEAVGTTSGWAFGSDGTDGVIVCNVEPAAGQNGFTVAKAQTNGSAAYACESNYISDTQIQVTVRATADQAAIDLSTTVVAIQLIAATL